MADQSDVTSSLFETLPMGNQRSDWQSAAVIDCWGLEASPNETELTIAGIGSASEKSADGSCIRTSAARAVNENRRFVVTQNSIQLGWPARAALDAEADHSWPPLLLVATCANSYGGAAQAAHG